MCKLNGGKSAFEIKCIVCLQIDTLYDVHTHSHTVTLKHGISTQQIFLLFYLANGIINKNENDEYFQLFGKE